MSRKRNELPGFRPFSPLSAYAFSAEFRRVRKVQHTQRDGRGHLYAENSVRSTPLFRGGGRNGNAENRRRTKRGRNDMILAASSRGGRP